MLLFFFFSCLPFCLSLMNFNILLLVLAVTIFMSPYHSLVQSMVFFGLKFDNFSMLLSLMLISVLMISSFSCFEEKNNLMSSMLLSLIFFVSMFMFFTDNLIFLYINYEISLLPIAVIILYWGSYPERSLSAIMLITYTSLFTLPFLYILNFIFVNFNSFSLSCITYALSVSPFKTLPNLLSVLVFLVFTVKLPIYGLHFWLPMAHVEAPTFGSMILAGVLLKLGGIGLVRCISVLNLTNFKMWMLAYLLIFLVYSTLVCCIQSDFKRVIAYSSVSHMMVLPILLLTFTLLSEKAFILTLIFHGLSSPALFLMVGCVNSMYSTKQLVLIQGVKSFSWILSFMMIMGFMFTVGIPPFPSFVSEMFFFSTASFWHPMTIAILVVFSVLSLIYNLNWLISTVFVTTSVMKKEMSNLSFMVSMSCMVLMMSCVSYIVFFTMI